MMILFNRAKGASENDGWSAFSGQTPDADANNRSTHGISSIMWLRK
jgi:hypothetical protein